MPNLVVSLKLKINNVKPQIKIQNSDDATRFGF